MKAVWLEDGKIDTRDDVPMPVAVEGEALVRVVLAGICNTDLELVKGYYPFTGIPGHEFVGRIAASPSCQEREGERVTGSINAVCHNCDMCRKGLPGHCRRRTVLGISGRNGVFAEFAVLPLENLHTVPARVPDVRAVFTEPLAAALQVTEQIEISKRERIIVAGSGKLGQLISESLHVQGFNVEAVVKYPSQRKRLEKLRVPCRAVEDLEKSSYDVVVEATGTPDGLGLSLDLVRPRGTLVLKSTYKGNASVDLSRLVVDEITLKGSRCGPFPKALELLASGKVAPENMIQEVFSLEEGGRAFEAAATPGAGKILLEMISE